VNKKTQLGLKDTMENAGFF